MNDPAGAERRRWARRSISLAVRMVFPTHGLKEVTEATFDLRDISEGGASLFVGSIATPDFFYLQLGQDAAELIGCYTVNRTSDTVSCRFNRLLDAREIERLIEESRMVRETLDTLFDSQASDELDSLFEKAGELFS
ncbi:hypothetical protein [Mesorhizobium sp. B1-1-5]|uniref:hypothetical protein n=1 Tax=Mesorhizobium sp. B1-1-5 TaxID=2589979 RepID=UPI00112A05A4|nr:hypothetical protein [Mesorhizobium sp. B1-1-5]TPO08218.1 hypothetical protein FJ980_11185 [Mesorhizobium sp. B1-1-5]